MILHSSNESIGEDASLTWFEELAAERDSFGDVVLMGRLREAIRWLNQVIPSRPHVTLRDTLLPRLLPGKLCILDEENETLGEANE